MSLLQDAPMQDAWIVENPWLRNAFAHAPNRPAPTARADAPRAAPEPLPAPGPVDIDRLARRLHDLDAPSITRICALVESMLGSSESPTVRRA